MTERDPWKRFQASCSHVAELDVRVDASRVPFPSDFFGGVTPLLEDAFVAMAGLEAGGIANPDEGRMVGHYWLRRPELAPSAELRDAIATTLARIDGFARDVHDGTIAPEKAPRFTDFLLVGIGGSALGPEFVADALGGTGDRLRPHFLDNTDPDGFDRVLAELGDALATTLTVVISKSGGTVETRNGMLEVEAAYRRRGLVPGRHAVAVTGEGSALARHAEAAGYLASFPMWDWVGGRTSETSAVGLLPAALQGLDVQGLLDGARLMDDATRIQDGRRNPAALLALAWMHLGEGRGMRDMVVLPYKDRLVLFSRYLQQLVMESLGKEHDLEGRLVEQGLTVYGNKGSTDQHAFVQQLRDGRANFFVTFVDVLADRAGDSLEVEPDVTAGDYLTGFLLGTREALAEKDRATVTVTVPDVSARSIGALIALYERAVGLYAALIGINAYHQPGVEAGKKAAATVVALERRILAALRAHHGAAHDVPSVAALVGAEDRVDTVFTLLEHLAASAHHPVQKRAGQSLWDAQYGIGIL